MKSLALLFAAVLAPAQVVTVEPGCPQWQRTSTADGHMTPPAITIRYNPASPGARFQSPETLRIILANAININRFDSVTIPLARSGGGSWQAVYTPKKNYILGYSIFFVQDEKGHVDNNHNQYWEILNCDGSQVNRYAVEAQARTYEGTLLAPGIQRAPDLPHAIAIIKEDLLARPQAVNHYFALWDLELKQNAQTPAAFQQIGKELDAFLDSHAANMRAMQQVAGFVTGFQHRLPSAVVERYRAALVALPQTAEPIEINSATKESRHIPRDVYAARAQKTVTRILADFDYGAINSEDKDSQKVADEYLRFAAQYPASTLTSSAYEQAFHLQEKTGDTAALENIFEKWTAAKPGEPFPFVELAQFCIDQKTKPARVLELLNSAEKIYTESEAPSSHIHFHREPGKLESLRGQAHLLLADLSASRTDFEAAWKAAPENPDNALALGRVCEQMGDSKAALQAYLAAASTPYQKNPEPHRSYARLFVSQHLGSEQNAEENIEKAAAERGRATAAEYTPLPLNRPTPEFSFTDLAGKRLDSQSLKGKPTVITFWGIWCAPCIAELPAIQEFQRRHPNANTLAVEIGDKPDKIKAFLSAHNLNNLHVASQADWPEQFGFAAAPMGVVMDRFGQTQFVHAGLLADVDAILSKDLSVLSQPN